ncbi:MAG: nicotinate (nicotinamide) nucleotide adenylyltransferase [Clostridia bacterium]|nr:nicotinate (nicotinamide) nucleotide adenylyltransferase [Clostridia bacterium]
MNKNQLYKGKNKKIGILGGTFNPVHNGHIHMAKCAMEKLGLDRVVFMAAGIPPHKMLAFNTSPEDRINMLKLAIRGNDQFFIDDFEAGSAEKAYSYISLERIHESLNESSALYFIIGADSLMQLDKWKRPEKLLSLCTFAVIPRDGYTKVQCEEKIDELTKEYGGEILYLDCEKYNMSSTVARDYDYDETSSNLDENVAEYIRLNGLYSNHYDTEEIEKYLKANLSKKRLEHVYGTVKCAGDLAKAYGANIQKAKLAALLHDCAKHMSNEEILFLSQEYGFEIDEIYQLQPELLHGAAGAYISKNVFSVDDQEILDAISYHTVPRLEMSKLDKIICVADLLEETREYPGIDKLRKLQDKGLDILFEKVLERVIIHVVERNQLLHTNSVVVYNNLLKEKRKSDKLKQTQGEE